MANASSLTNTTLTSVNSTLASNLTLCAHKALYLAHASNKTVGAIWAASFVIGSYFPGIYLVACAAFGYFDDADRYHLFGSVVSPLATGFFVLTLVSIILAQQWGDYCKAGSSHKSDAGTWAVLAIFVLVPLVVMIVLSASVLVGSVHGIWSSYGRQVRWWHPTLRVRLLQRRRARTASKKDGVAVSGSSAQLANDGVSESQYQLASVDGASAASRELEDGAVGAHYGELLFPHIKDTAAPPQYTP
ncbi:hypothetical protein BAUCODRAFT_436086 [Baudoinia panamericana UAMH 10762]|uniref:Uncharacterized protein n=1 Tax=Baudoinia panamericana (strain UAMH 10762) TaxID=717646 RepID=M2MZJ9_BAUPA|nr:uncharacterized protein BAUCODRAFT_436086 [Baudoinia panamericana UAMH 10762]EMC97033.1 hypothetical protein BAUCODRAFT_436086 [Baudoinia panamericana UAMH 10762]